MKSLKHIIATLTTALLMWGCTERIYFDTRDADPVLVVYGAITSESQCHSVVLSRSGSFFEDESTKFINDATVRLESSAGAIYPMPKSPTEKGTYRTIDYMQAIPGLYYTLYISVDFDEDGEPEEYVITTETVLHPVEFDLIEIVPLNIMGLSMYNLLLSGHEPAGPNYYVDHLYVNDLLKTPNIGSFYDMSDDLIDGTYLDRQPFTTFFPEESRDLIPESQQLKVLFLSPNDNVTLQFGNVSKGYYDFVRQAKSSKQGSNPMFGGPSSNIITNVPGGAGYFTAYAISTLSTTVPETEQQ